MATNKIWLAQLEEIPIEPELPICDPHHHLWDGRRNTVEPRYLLDELLADLDCGHNIVSTIFIECGTMFKALRPEEYRVISETEFVNGIAAMSAAGLYGGTQHRSRHCRYRLSHSGRSCGRCARSADGGRFRGVRQAASWHKHPRVGNHRTEPGEGLYLRSKFREGFAHLAPRELSYEAWCYHTQLGELESLARAFPC